MLSVSDTGVGMREDVRNRAFEPFFTTKEVHKGTGLGLSIVYGFAQQSGGTATIDSEIDEGTTIHIYLPRAPRLSERTGKQGDQGLRKAGAPSRILIVDDNSAVRTITAAMVRTLGHDTVEAAGGQIGLDLLQQDREFDLLIVDLAMPNMHGDEFVARAREMIPGVPALFVTGYAEPGWGRRRYDALLKKPFRIAQLAEQLRQILPAVKR
jgi:CheY-like chemotaxis protein